MSALEIAARLVHNFRKSPTDVACMKFQAARQKRTLGIPSTAAKERIFAI